MQSKECHRRVNGLSTLGTQSYNLLSHQITSSHQSGWKYMYLAALLLFMSNKFDALALNNDSYTLSWFQKDEIPYISRTCFHHYGILTKTRCKMMTAISFSCQTWHWLTHTHFSIGKTHTHIRIKGSALKGKENTFNNNLDRGSTWQCNSTLSPVLCIFSVSWSTAMLLGAQTRTWLKN